MGTLTLDNAILGSCLSREGAMFLLRDWFLGNLPPHTYGQKDILAVDAKFDGQPVSISQETWFAWWK